MLRAISLILAFSLSLTALDRPRALTAGPDSDPSPGFETLREQDQRAARVSFALRRTARKQCRRAAPLLGWTLHNATQYSLRVRDGAQRHFRLVGDYPAILVVVRGGPAAASNLEPNDSLLAINGLSLGQATVEGEANFAPLARAIETLNNELANPGVLLIERDGKRREVAITAELGCAYETQVDPSPHLQASADAQRVFVTSAMAAFTADDDELAVVLGHEYAHILLGHPPDPLAPRHRAGKSTRARTGDQEVEADRLGLRLAQGAGFDIAAGPRLIDRLGRAKPWLRLLLWRRLGEMRREIERLGPQSRAPEVS